MNVSVVIPLYNKAPHIRRTIDSVLRQTYSDFEIIVVDDGSTDGGHEVVQSYTDNRIKLIRQVNQGVSAARNKGIACAESELVAFLDADDEWCEDFLETVINLHSHFPQAGLYGTNFLICENACMRKNSLLSKVAESEGCLIDNYFERVTLGSPPFWSSSVMIPKIVLNNIDGFPVGVKTGEDIHTWIRIALRYPIACSSKECAIYHLDAVNRVAGREPREDLAWANLIEQADIGKLSPTEQLYCKEFLCKRRLKLATLHIIAGRLSQARSLIFKTSDTRIFRVRRYTLLVLSLFPHSVVNLLFSVKRKFFKT